MRRMLIVLALAGALFAGCGGDDDEPETAATPEPTAESTPADDGGSSSSGGGQSVDVSAPESGALEFDPKEITVKSGEVTVTVSPPPEGEEPPSSAGVDSAVGDGVAAVSGSSSSPPHPANTAAARARTISMRRTCALLSWSRRPEGGFGCRSEGRTPSRARGLPSTRSLHRGRSGSARIPRSAPPW